MKSEVKANLHKKSGNELYLKSEHSAALIEYNKALCYAESDELKSLLYGNRSAIYFEVKRYKLCLVNIQLAIKSGYPHDKLLKLHARAEKCNEFLSAGLNVNENDEKIAEFFKLSYKSHPKIPFIIDGIELKTSEKYGNHLITNKDLITGDIIAIEPLTSFFAWLNVEYYYENCANCLCQNFFSLIPSERCCDTMYCSESCKTQFETTYHFERSSDVKKRPIDGCFEVSYRIIMTAIEEFGSVEEFNKLLQNPRKLTIFDVDELSTRNILEIFCSMRQSENRKKLASQVMKEALTEWAKSMKFQDVLHPVVASYLTNGISFQRSFYEGEKFNCRSVGDTILVFGSLFNHSCDANINRVELDNKMVFYVCRPIKAGEQLFIHYGPTYEGDSLHDRREHLLTYDFQCDCDACTNNYPLLDDLRKLNRIHEMPIINSTMSPDKSIDVFKKCCEFINKLQHAHPCYEMSKSIIHSNVIINQIANLKPRFKC